MQNTIGFRLQSMRDRTQAAIIANTFLGYLEQNS